MVDGQLNKMTQFMKQLFLIAILFTSVLTACKDDEFDGLFNVDPMPANAVTFPDAQSGNIVLMDDNAFIINQNSVASGQIQVRLKGPSSKQIVSVEPRAQRFRGSIIWPNVSPTVPTAAAQRAPATFNRSMASLGETSISAASEVTYSLDLSNLPASLMSATLTEVTAPVGENPVYEVFRFFFLVKYNDGSSILTNEVRVIVKG
jgi:hypothetical protein